MADKPDTDEEMSIEKQQSTTGTFYPVLSISFQKSP
jgi:hypothetical protein